MSARIARAACVMSLCAACWSAPSLAQESDEPRLPKGGVAPPAELLAGLPAEAVDLYRPILRTENAEVAYLVALSEFERGMADCWPEKGRSSRRQLLKEREKRLDAVFDPADLKGLPIDPQARDAVLPEYRAGWEGLIRAQQRARCRFAIAIDPGAAIPHVYAARRVERVARLLATADLEKGDLDAALGRLSVVLRLSRDLRPGGTALCQVASVAIDASARDHIALPILRSTALRPEHCNRLIALWRTQERDALDPFRALLFPEALVAKAMIAQLGSNPRTRDSIVSMLQSDAPGKLAEAFDELTGSHRKTDSAPANRRAGNRLAAMTDADFVAAQKRIDGYFGRWWRLAPTSFEARVKAAPEIAREALGDDPFLGQLIPGAKFFIGMAETATRESFTLGAMQSLAAVRRWTLERGGPPPDLAAATTAAGFPDTPRDPFTDAPLKLAFTAGSPLIYSIGPDHKDDGGKIDTRFDARRDGDWLIRLSAESPGQ
jgi:hypothetical protein